MSITIFILALITLLLGFIGLVILIFGFKNNNVSNIIKGAIVFCIALLLFTIMSFKLTKVLIKHYKQKVHSIGTLMNNNCCGQQKIDKCCDMKGIEIMEKCDTIVIEKKIEKKIK